MIFCRSVAERIRSLATQFPAVVVTGARQVGKTTLLRELFPEHRYLSLDLPSEAMRAELEPEFFLGDGTTPLLIDEVQYAPKLFRHLKVAIDANRKQCGRFILTGSQKFTLMKEVSDSLAGRVGIVELEGLSFSELLAAGQKPDWPSVLWRGSFPELWSSATLQPTEFFRGYVATYLERDIRQLIQVASLRDFERFLRACAARNGQVLNKRELARDVGINEKTASQWLSVAAASNQITLLEPYFSNITKRLTKSPKLYFNDTGLLCFLLGLPLEAVSGFSGVGAIWEAFIFGELRKLREAYALESSLWFYRDDSKREVDFLLDWQGRLTLLEAKWSELISPRESGSLKAVSTLLGNRAGEQFVVCRTANSYPLGDGARAIGAGALRNLFLPPTERSW